MAPQLPFWSRHTVAVCVVCDSDLISDLSADRTRTRQSAGWRVHQWPSVAQSHSSENRRTGRRRSASLRHFATVAGVARMRVQDPEPLPGNRKHPAGCHWRIQAQGDHQRRREEDRRLSARESQHFLVGDPRQTHQGIELVPPSSL